MAAAPANHEVSPLVHAIGGSIGSALALMLFYPLERARIELQSQVSRQFNTPKSQEEGGEVLDSIEENVDLGEASPELKSHPADAVSSTSWSPVHLKSIIRIPETLTNSDEFSPSWDLGSASSTNSKEEAAEEKASQPPSRSSLLQCLAVLQERGTLYQGVTPVITTIFASQFVFFFLHAYMNRVMQRMSFFADSSNRQSMASSHAVRSLLSSCLAGIGNVLMTNPLWVANMAIITGEAKTSSLCKELMFLLRSKGLKHLWSGTAASILLVSNPVIQFFSYEQIKHARLAYSGKKSIERHVLPPVEAFVAGAIAKSIATVTTYPLQLTQTILRLDNNGYDGLFDCLLKLYRRSGYKEWYRGMRVKLLQTVLTAAFTFLTYEQILGAVQLALVRSAGLPQVAP